MFSNLSEAQIYEYVDETGKKVFVDRLSKVPAKYRSQLESREESNEKLSQAEIDQLQLERDRQLAISKISTERRRIQEAMRKWITPFQFQSNRVLLPVRISYGGRQKTLSLVMDTGASVTVLHKDALQSLSPQFLSGGAARVADGRVVLTEKVSLNSVEIGPYKAENIQASVIDFKGGSGSNQGLLGMDFLYNARFELDREKQHIRWYPEKYQALQDKLDELNILEQQLKSATAVPEE
ncbi:retropepsin-like aspartic protease [Neptuniibacter caesariensis]|uniref:Peptidase A2 domain-containing protein n=1 Tax=Neptuniibacter caesariensis TaxID=207954 RepID=A0A7U8C5D8_NEPCE|nr:retropepsin-like aspartic protease [Neptuniibacter caesariensis]EAR61847.1 hypothetical protein MED92_02828 [Oceanospirillum sp. MED92] [Neptuniibacter caesariensis]